MIFVRCRVPACQPICGFQGLLGKGVGEGEVSLPVVCFPLHYIIGDD